MTSKKKLSLEEIRTVAERIAQGACEDCQRLHGFTATWRWTGENVLTTFDDDGTPLTEIDITVLQ